MTLFVLGVIVGWALEYVVYTFWWKGRVAASSNSSPDCSEYEAKVSAKDREIAQLQLKLQAAATAAVAATQKEKDEKAEPVAAESDAPKEEAVKEEAPAVAEEKVAEAQENEQPKEPAPAPEKKKAAKKAAPKKAAVKKAAKPKTAAKEKVIPLEEISGIGSVIGKVLRSEGYEGAVSLADADVTKIQSIMEKAEIRLGNIPSWIDQAKLIKAGDMDGLADYKKSLK